MGTAKRRTLGKAFTAGVAEKSRRYEENDKSVVSVVGSDMVERLQQKSFLVFSARPPRPPR